jgi:hypothetical protein
MPDVPPVITIRIVLTLSKEALAGTLDHQLNCTDAGGCWNAQIGPWATHWTV